MVVMKPVCGPTPCRLATVSAAADLPKYHRSRARSNRLVTATQILVFHFPGVIERVKGGVPYQEPERPFRLLASLLALGVVVPYCLAIGITIRHQSIVSQQHISIIGGNNPDTTRPVLLYEQRMPDDMVAVAPAAARPLLQLSRHTRTHRVEKRPARPHQRQLALQYFTRHDLMVDARKRERDPPEVGAAHARIVLGHVGGGDRRKRGLHPRQLRHRRIAWKVGE